jgi:hypothetical protein
MKALDNCNINSKADSDNHQSQMILAEYTSVQFLWAQGQKGIKGNEIVDQLATRGSMHLQDLNPLAASLRELQSRPSRTGCAERTRHIGSPSQDKDT